MQASLNAIVSGASALLPLLASMVPWLLFVLLVLLVLLQFERLVDGVVGLQQPPNPSAQSRWSKRIGGLLLSRPSCS